MNFSIAFEYYKKSAQLGNEKAQRSLGYFYDTGKGTKIDKSLVILLFFKHNFLQPKTNQKTKQKKKKQILHLIVTFILFICCRKYRFRSKSRFGI